MKLLFGLGILVVVLGLLSLVVAVPHSEREGFSAGGLSVGIQTQHSEKVSPIVSCALILAGAGMAIAGRSALRS